MGTSNATPNGAEASASNALLGLVDIDDAFAEVVAASLLFVDTLDLNESLVGSVVITASAESEEASFGPQANWGALVLSGGDLLGDAVSLLASSLRGLNRFRSFAGLDVFHPIYNFSKRIWLNDLSFTHAFRIYEFKKANVSYEFSKLPSTSTNKTYFD